MSIAQQVREMELVSAQWEQIRQVAELVGPHVSSMPASELALAILQEGELLEILSLLVDPRVSEVTKDRVRDVLRVLPCVCRR